MQISDLSPEARDAVCAWLRSLGHEYYNRSVEQYEADEPIDVVETTEAQGSALYAAADALADLGPPLLPWGFGPAAGVAVLGDLCGGAPRGFGEGGPGAPLLSRPGTHEDPLGLLADHRASVDAACDLLEAAREEALP